MVSDVYVVHVYSSLHVRVINLIFLLCDLGFEKVLLYCNCLGHLHAEGFMHKDLTDMIVEMQYHRSCLTEMAATVGQILGCLTYRVLFVSLIKYLNQQIIMQLGNYNHHQKMM